MSLTFTILGCGFSGGVPRPGFGWGHCNPLNPKNRRRRCSLLVERGEPGEACTRVLIDTSPDLREQLLDADVHDLDAVLLTHEHADHVHGIDDLRSLAIRHNKRIDTYLDPRTAATLRQRFGYLFETSPGSSYPPILNERRMRAGEPVTIEGRGGPIRIVPFVLGHGDIPSLGLRIGAGLAYSPDVKDIPEQSLPFLANLDVWVVDALLYRQHYSHFSVADALAWIARLKPKRAILTHMHSDLDYDALREKLPADVEPAFDGMTFSLPA